MSDIETLAGRPGRLIAASIKPGSQLTDSIEEICRTHGVTTAVITSVIGTVEELYLRNPREHTTLPIKQEHEWAHEIDTVMLRRKMEILSIQGNVTTIDGVREHDAEVTGLPQIKLHAG